ncbi:unnamed protein product [Prorocentrum cordatum]|uniref:Inositol-pentakisphosphate 2-kinase n=1 Tax=Prorocentrum cordatum TaxID=2364126 RepID=A0ABN9SPL0_9DINO|nr:unnamed protein product [Polarella glacialis]
MQTLRSVASTGGRDASKARQIELVDPARSDKRANETSNTEAWRKDCNAPIKAYIYTLASNSVQTATSVIVGPGAVLAHTFRVIPPSVCVACHEGRSGTGQGGFDAPPPAFNSMNPLSDVKDIAAGKKLEKKARRFMFQRMPATEVFMHLADVHQVPGYPDAAQDAVWTPQEVAEVVLHEVCSRLCALALACRAVPVPQKWVGSSVAVGFDAAALPPRSLAEEEVRRRVVVKIFDWGRSELNTPERHRRLSDAEKKDRAIPPPAAAPWPPARGRA